VGVVVVAWPKVTQYTVAGMAEECDVWGGRYESLRHCKWVDQVIEDAPWVVTDEFLEKHNIDYVCHDALPYADTSGQSSDGDVYHHLKVKGKFLETARTEVSEGRSDWRY